MPMARIVALLNALVKNMERLATIDEVMDFWTAVGPVRPVVVRGPLCEALDMRTPGVSGK